MANESNSMLRNILKFGLFAYLLSAGNSNGEPLESGLKVMPDKVLHRTIQVTFESAAGSGQSEPAVETKERVTFAADGEGYIISHHIDEIVFSKSVSELANGMPAFKIPYAYRSDAQFKPLEIYSPDDYWMQFAELTGLTRPEIAKIRAATSPHLLNILSKYDVLSLTEVGERTSQLPFVQLENITFADGMSVPVTATYKLIKNENGQTYIEKNSVTNPEGVKAGLVEMGEAYVQKYGGSESEVKEEREKLEVLPVDEKLSASESCTFVVEDKEGFPKEVKCKLYSSWDNFTENVIIKQQWK